MERNCLINVFFFKRCIYISIIGKYSGKLSYNKNSIFLILNYIIGDTSKDFFLKRKNKFCFLLEKFLKWGII